jgi:hypothetical protein
MKKTIKAEDSLPAGRYLNPGTSEYESGVVTNGTRGAAKIKDTDVCRDVAP